MSVLTFSPRGASKCLVCRAPTSRKSFVCVTCLDTLGPRTAARFEWLKPGAERDALIAQMRKQRVAA